MTDEASAVRPMRRVIVNADDFGQSEGINAGIVECHRSGIVTSASLMVRWPGARAAAAYASQTPSLSVGLHLDLGEWIHVDGAWRSIYHVVDASNGPAVRDEVARQLEAFRRLVEREPTHIDSHQHVHHKEPARSTIAEAADRLGIPVRGASLDVAYRGEFYGQTEKGHANHAAIRLERLIELLAALPPGTFELGCHPGLGRDAPGMYVAERQMEVDVLCDPRVRAAIAAEAIELMSFHEIADRYNLPAHEQRPRAWHRPGRS